MNIYIYMYIICVCFALSDSIQYCKPSKHLMTVWWDMFICMRNIIRKKKQIVLNVCACLCRFFPHIHSWDASCECTVWQAQALKTGITINLLFTCHEEPKILGFRTGLVRFGYIIHEFDPWFNYRAAATWRREVMFTAYTYHLGMVKISPIKWRWLGDGLWPWGWFLHTRDDRCDAQSWSPDWCDWLLLVLGHWTGIMDDDDDTGASDREWGNDPKSSKITSNSHPSNPHSHPFPAFSTSKWWWWWWWWWRRRRPPHPLPRSTWRSTAWESSSSGTTTCHGIPLDVP